MMNHLPPNHLTSSSSHDDTSGGHDDTSGGGGGNNDGLEPSQYGTVQPINDPILSHPLRLPAPQVDDAAFDGLWDAISAQLDQDDRMQAQSTNAGETGNEPVFDASWASTYMDEELANDQERLLFEVAMSHQPQLSQWVEQAQAVSDTIRQYAYRLETQCAALDCAPVVMRQLDQDTLRAETHRASGGYPLSPSDLELLGQWHDDQPMEPAQTAYVQALLNDQDDVRQRVDGLGLLGAILAEYQHRLEANAPLLNELACKRLVRQSPPSLFGSIKLWQGAKMAVASMLIAVVGFNVMTMVDARADRDLPSIMSSSHATAPVVVRGAQIAAHGGDGRLLASRGHEGMDAEPGSSSGWAPGGPDGPYENGSQEQEQGGSGISAEAGADQAPTLVNEQAPPPTAEEYLMQLQDQQYTVNEYEMSVEL